MTDHIGAVRAASLGPSRRLRRGFRKFVLIPGLAIGAVIVCSGFGQASLLESFEFTNLVLAFLLVLSMALIRWRVMPPRYAEPFRSLAWAMGKHEQAYNFGVVVPGRIFRSGQPDDRFLRYAMNTYGIRRVISLNGESVITPHSRGSGLTETVFSWETKYLPPTQELQSTLDLLDEREPVLVYCGAGRDRTGFLVAAYRVMREGWAGDRALGEMETFRHSRDRYPRLGDHILQLAGATPNPGTINLGK